MEMLVQRVNPEQIEMLMDGLRTQGQELHDLESALAEPLEEQPGVGGGFEEDDPIELVLPDAPQHRQAAKQMVMN
jgi:hypothetical protein